jgi:hypothetical protein
MPAYITVKQEREKLRSTQRKRETWHNDSILTFYLKQWKKKKMEHNCLRAEKIEILNPPT